MMNEQVKSMIEAANTKMELDLRRAETLHEMTVNALAILSAKLPAIEAALNVQGLSLTSVSTAKTGTDHTTWSSGDSLRVELQATSPSDKFRFLTFRGYTAQGKGKNDAKLRERADKLTAVLRGAAGIERLTINPNSLEVREERKSVPSVSISLWI